MLPSQVLLARTPPVTSAVSVVHHDPSILSSSAPRPVSAASPLQESPPLIINPIFFRTSRNPGTVSITVEGIEFFCHRDILIFSSSFFESLLLGDWQETARTPSVNNDAFEEPTQDLISLTAALDTTTLTSSFADDITEAGVSIQPVEDDEEDPSAAMPKLTARITLGEETASAFHDLLCFIYPNLEILVTWQNVEPLVFMANKFGISSLKRHCSQFLMSSAAGRPIQAMSIAETFDLHDLYKEASRFLLDNFSNWTPEELEILSHDTLIKLERKHSWFLAHTLRLSVVSVMRDYVCHPQCADPSLCARLLDDKWKSAWQSGFRHGPPRPSIIYRSLRQLEPSMASPALHMPSTSCQNHGRGFIASLFDRMYEIRGFPVLGPNNYADSSGASNKNRYFLFIDSRN